MPQLKFSVVIPVYNCAPYLRECLDSVCAAVEKVKMEGAGAQREDIPLVEVICVDDGSTDGCGAILDSYAERLNVRTPEQLNFLVRHQANKGEGGARNAALEVATGDWVMFLDGDDVIADHAFVTLRAAVSAHPGADLIRFKGVKFKGGGAVAWRSPWRFDGFSTMLYARRICGQRRFCGFRHGADRIFMAEVLAAAAEVVEIRETLYGYRQNPTSAMGARISADRVRSRVECPLWVLEIYASRPERLGARARRVLENEYLECFWEELEEIEECERTELRSLWRASLARFLSVGHVRWFNRLRARTLSCCGWGWLVFVLCRIPMIFKRMGVHR